MIRTKAAAFSGTRMRHGVFWTPWFYVFFLSFLDINYILVSSVRSFDMQRVVHILNIKMIKVLHFNDSWTPWVFIPFSGRPSAPLSNCPTVLSNMRGAVILLNQTAMAHRSPWTKYKILAKWWGKYWREKKFEIISMIFICCKI